MISRKLKYPAIVTCLCGLLGASFLLGASQRPAPDAHEGISAASLGVVNGTSMKNTLQLEGYKLQLREIGLAPGGKIARHDHATKPGIVWMLEGSWTEGRDSGETTYTSGGDNSFLIEDENTTHWFFNDTDKPARAIVCDIVPDS